MPTSSPRVTDWVFTLNNPKTLLDPPASVAYLVYQEEVGENGTHHFQGFVQFKTPRTLRGVKRELSSDAMHLEVRRGSVPEAAAYCKKRDSTYIDGPYEFGVVVEKASIRVLKRRLEEGATNLELLNEMPDLVAHKHAFIKFAREALGLPSVSKRTRATPTVTTILCVGDARAGKSKWCHDTYPGAYIKGHDKWWSNYAGQPVILLDDFYGWMPYNQFLTLCDPYAKPMEVETKGGHSTVAPETVLITSNEGPCKWWSKIDAFNKEAVYGRITHVRYYSEGHIYPFDPPNAVEAYYRFATMPGVVERRVLAHVN